MVKQTIEDEILNLRNRYLLLLDAFTLPLAAYLAFVLRLDLSGLGRYGSTAFVYALVSLLIKSLVFGLFGGYTRYWPFASMSEVTLILKSVVVGEFLASGLTFLLTQQLGLPQPPRSIPVLGFFLTGVALAGPRLLLRWLYYWIDHAEALEGRARRRVLIVGAGEGGHLVAQEIRRNPQLGLVAVGFIDDDKRKQNLEIRGIRIVGQVADIPRIVEGHSIHQVLIAIPTATAGEMRRIVDVCRQADVDVLTLPGIFEVIAGDVRIDRFRPVQVEDLLVREPVQTDTTQVQLLLRNKVVLVTGAGGSIGSELCRQIARCRPAQLVLLGHGETSIYRIQRELCGRFPDLLLEPVIADTRHVARIDRIFALYRPEVVFHAAAHKHVPLMELNPTEAVTNNVGGTRNVLRASERYDVHTFIMISTDKAVNPTSIMGATKRVAEHLVQEAACRTGRHFAAVRFGNVLGSRGSVVPVFERQIKNGGPVTVTHPEIKRYFMTIPEAVQLVLQAASLGEGGEVFVLDMGEPVKIVDLARDMIRLAGFKVDEEIEIKFTGLRPGEKLFEELFLDDEHYQRTLHEKIFVSRNGTGPASTLEQKIGKLLTTAEAGETAEMIQVLHDLVPECVPELGERALDAAGHF